MKQAGQIALVEPGLDELLFPEQADFAVTGLKVPSVLRLSRLATIDGGLLVGSIGALHPDRIRTIRQRLGNWLVAEDRP